MLTTFTAYTFRALQISEKELRVLLEKWIAMRRFRIAFLLDSEFDKKHARFKLTIHVVLAAIFNC